MFFYLSYGYIIPVLDISYFLSALRSDGRNFHHLRMQVESNTIPHCKKKIFDFLEIQKIYAATLNIVNFLYGYQ